MVGIDAIEFKRTMASVPSPVSVVTTVDPVAGGQFGFTASSLTSLSVDPPLVLVCLARGAGCHPVFVRTPAFLVSVLAAEHDEVARRFAGAGTDKFAGGDMVPCELGLPGMVDAAARLACITHAVLDGGDHSILVGRVEAAYCGAQEPLVYHRREFTKPAPLPLTAGAR